MKGGDFGELIPAGEGVIYDPTTTRAVGSGFERDPFPNNAIPVDRHRGISTKIWGLVPNPDAAGLFNNIFALGNARNDNENRTVLQQSFCKFVCFHEVLYFSAPFHSQSLSVLVCR